MSEKYLPFSLQSDVCMYILQRCAIQIPKEEVGIVDHDHITEGGGLPEIHEAMDLNNEKRSRNHEKGWVCRYI